MTKKILGQTCLIVLKRQYQSNSAKKLYDWFNSYSKFSRLGRFCLGVEFDRGGSSTLYRVDIFLAEQSYGSKDYLTYGQNKLLI